MQNKLFHSLKHMQNGRNTVYLKFVYHLEVTKTVDGIKYPNDKCYQKIGR